MNIVNKCRPNNIGSNNWCLSTLFSLGEGADLVFLPAILWGQIKQRWLTTNTASGEGAPPILSEKQGGASLEYIYNAPEAASALETLFPEAESSKEGVYFQGNNLIFNPTLGNSIEADGVPYQTSNFSLPVGSSKEYDELVRYLQARAWVGIKLNHDATVMHVYGGPRGYFPKADEVAEMTFSGNGDSKGKTSATFAVEKANYAIEYVTIGEQTPDSSALQELMGYLKEGACKPNGSVAPELSVTPAELSFAAAGEAKSVTVEASGEYGVSSKPEWITVSGAQLTASANADSATRGGVVVFALNDYPQVTASVNVSQAGA